MPEEKKDIGITVKKQDDLPEWYEQVCLKAELAEFSPVKGCMVIRPNGYAIWEAVQAYFNANIIKPMGVKNAYFPLFIPESFFHKEAEHAEGFSPEVAWLDKEITGEGERLAVRPTSETIMYDSYSRWIRSHKDLPLRINQWCNVVRWETQATKLFLRSREFLWQEGHCVYATEEECEHETIEYLKRYATLCKELLALPVLIGRKTEKEKFAGAKTTYTIEAFMPDGKALQCGTSHNLGQGFAKAFGISFTGKDEKMHTPWQNSWGLSTRLIGAVIMTHSDDKGAVLPPAIAHAHVAIVPIIFEDSKEEVMEVCKTVKDRLKGLSVILDDRDDYTAGWKFNEWEMKGVPIRIEIGPKDVAKKQVVIVRRDSGKKSVASIDEAYKEVSVMLESMQHDLYRKAEEFLESSIVEAKSWKEFTDAIQKRKLVKGIFCGEIECEDTIKDKTGGASSRCIPLDDEPVEGNCLHCGNPAQHKIFYSKSY
ncbi:proline--tRNA ligase [Candidatus Woesearchaeota archaeon]|nr:proline--tRNA ligase [Candidatus Woesearchaeota archaeon]